MFYFKCVYVLGKMREQTDTFPIYIKLIFISSFKDSFSHGTSFKIMFSIPRVELLLYEHWNLITLNKLLVNDTYFSIDDLYSDSL